MKTTLLGRIWTSVGLMAITLCALTAPQARGEASKLNVLFIAVDDLRPQLGCYGDPTAKTPNINRLARSGMVFDRAYCQQALCSPSRISLLSGRYPTTSKIFTIGPALRETLPDAVTLPQHFKQNGYFTRSLGKVFHEGIDDPQSWSQPSWRSSAPRNGTAGEAAIAKRRAALQAAGKPLPKKGADNPVYAAPLFDAPDVADEALRDGDVAREGVTALRALAANPTQPFFLAVGFNNPHLPWVAPKKYWNLYRPGDLKLPANPFPPRHAPPFAARSGDDFYWYDNSPKDRVVTPELGRQCLHAYLAAISYIDAQIGRLLDELDRLKLRERTVVVLWGDHGYYMGEHGWWGGKHNNYEGATRAPLIVTAPGMKAAGQHCKALVEFVDIYPSLAELCGLPKPEEVEGASFRRLLDSPAMPGKKAAFSWYPHNGSMGTAVRTDRYRYVEWKDRQGRVTGRELYDEQNDPEENENIYEAHKGSAVVKEMQALVAGAGT